MSIRYMIVIFLIVLITSWSAYKVLVDIESVLFSGEYDISTLEYVINYVSFDGIRLGCIVALGLLALYLGIELPVRFKKHGLEEEVLNDPYLFICYSIAVGVILIMILMIAYA